MKGRLARVAMLVTFVVLLALFARHIQWRATVEALRHASLPLLALALVLNLGSLVLKAVRWWLLLRSVGVRSLSLVIRATFAGASLNNMVVAQGGEGARVMYVARKTGVPVASITAALTLERVLDAMSYLALLTTAAWLFPLPDALARWRFAAAGLLALAVAGLAWLCRPARSSQRRGRRFFDNFAASARTICTPSRLVMAMALSLSAWALQVATYHIVALAAHLPVTLGASVAAQLAIGISFLVRATPGNVGVFQVIYALIMRGFGIPEDAAVAAALLIQAVQVLPTLFIGTALTPALVRPPRSGPAPREVQAPDREHADPTPR